MILDRLESGRALNSEPSGLNSFRAGRLRIVYRFIGGGKSMEVVAVGTRKTIYEETLRFVRIKRK